MFPYELKSSAFITIFLLKIKNGLRLHFALIFAYFSDHKNKCSVLPGRCKIIFKEKTSSRTRELKRIRKVHETSVKSA